MAQPKYQTYIVHDDGSMVPVPTPVAVGAGVPNPLTWTTAASWAALLGALAALVAVFLPQVNAPAYVQGASVVAAAIMAAINGLITGSGSFVARLERAIVAVVPAIIQAWGDRPTEPAPETQSLEHRGG